MDSDYPKKISDGFQGIPSDVDAAMVWGGNGKIYFFKGITLLYEIIYLLSYFRVHADGLIL